MCATLSVFEVESLPGLERAKQTIRRILNAGDQVHAVLLTGAEGSSAIDLAKFLAAGWLCSAGDHEAPCGQCSGCRSMEAGTCVDFQLIEPSGAGEQIQIHDITERKANSGKDATCIPVTRFLRTRPLLAKHKVIILNRADRLTFAATNSLLKTLEEPGAHAKLILITSEPSRIPPTVLSRCQVVTCSLPGLEDLESHFGSLATPEHLFGKGAPNRIQSIRDHLEPYTELANLLNSLNKWKPGAGLMVSQGFQRIADQFGEKLGVGARRGDLELLECVGEWARAECPGVLHEIVETHRRVRGNANASLQFDALSAQILRELDARRNLS